MLTSHYRCSGNYHLFLYQLGLKQLPLSTVKDSRFRHVRYGYLVGLTGDQIAYAVQAAQDEQGVVLFMGEQEVCKADILPDNYSCTDEKMYIGFNHTNHLKLLGSALAITPSPKDCSVTVMFELKHHYFNSLREFVTEISEDVILKLVPKKKDFEYPFKKNNNFEHCKVLCSPDQFKALEAIVFSPSNGPPVLIAGPFGTGKTHTLATAAHALFHEAQLTSQFLRILVCTHHKRSASNFLEIFKGLHQHFPLNRRIKPFLICRNSEKEITNWQVKQFCITTKKVLHYIQHHPNRGRTNFLFVATCMSCSQLNEGLIKGFFTHVMIDEGAQMREPEAVASLCLANRNTKIVITGDHLQVMYLVAVATLCLHMQHL